MAGPYILYPVPHGMDDHCQGLRPGDPPCGHPCPDALFQPLPLQPAPLPGIYLNKVTGAKGVYLTTGDTKGQAVPLDLVHHMAMGPQLPNTEKPRHPLARRGARDPRPVDPTAPGPDRALLHLTMKHTARLPANLAGEKYFILEGLTDDIITLATNTLAATTDAWDDAAGHPTARRDRVQETEDTLTPDLVNHLVNLTSPLEQHNRKTEGPKVTDWKAFIHRPPHTPTVTLTCHQHTWWVAEWNVTGTTDRVQTFTPVTKTATPVTLGDRSKHSTHHTNHPRGHWLALKRGDALDSGCPSHRHHGARDVSHIHSQPGSLHTKTRDSKGGTLDVLAGGHGTNPQTSHHQPTRTSEPTSRYAPTTRGARTGIQHLLKPQRAEAGPQIGTRTTPARAEARSTGSGHLGPPGQTAKAGAESSPSATTA